MNEHRLAEIENYGVFLSIEDLRELITTVRARDARIAELEAALGDIKQLGITDCSVCDGSETRYEIAVEALAEKEQGTCATN